jgi:hypothetical protein
MGLDQRIIVTTQRNYWDSYGYPVMGVTIAEFRKCYPLHTYLHTHFAPDSDDQRFTVRIDQQTLAAIYNSYQMGDLTVDGPSRAGARALLQTR